jgi:hypothetical protein
MDGVHRTRKSVSTYKPLLMAQERGAALDDAFLWADLLPMAFFSFLYLFILILE